jgi:hypothetical protein
MVLTAGKPEADALLFKLPGDEVFIEAFGETGRIESIIYDDIFRGEEYAV